MSLPTLPKVQKLQRVLHVKAKESPDCRFYSLYDKIYRRDILWVAYRRCLVNQGAEGVDGVTFDDIESYGVMRWLDEVADELKKKEYAPQAVRRVYIPKPNGDRRPLGIPTIKDRVVQTAAMLVLEAIFEADLQPEQYAYRPRRSALDAVRHLHALLRHGHTEVIDADLSGYFDTIPHAELMRCVVRRVADRSVLRLIKMWLHAAVEETDRRGRVTRTTCNRDQSRGTPQGAPISPLLSNLYMRRFILGWKVLGYEQRYQAKIVNYADDFVICCRASAAPSMIAMRQMMRQLKLTVNERKTRSCHAWRESFDFLGYTIGTCYSAQTGKAYLGTRPSKQKIKRLCRTISDLTDRRATREDTTYKVERLNRILNGWANYFHLGPVGQAYRAIDRHAARRLRHWLCIKHKVRGQRGTSRFPSEFLHNQLGLVQLQVKTRNLPWANT